ncbi:MAG: UDP-N-acetylmuramate--L-alanyl-gamma-D-glutamyl-meso-2,6-diaminoheptandioate ligase [Gammaproteobacteria bacterium]|nr:UDP-N-acetylmuramate--L-alanyl-gamma-D-glutamyl-meso-2,6-diaminoheptandioate ligase [Gammaproteobacteria bacterium]
MGGIALLARELGHQVSGSDANVYPPMSTLLACNGITLMEGYDPEHLRGALDVVVVGNAMSRGNPAVEHVLNRGMRYTSGPQWLAENLLQDRWVMAVAGTHGKTTTTSMLAWMLEHAGLKPGFLIGGVAENFGTSARVGDAPFFVVEADEYDTAFFDKRSKFLHYRPRTAILNNLEYDHADIFPDLAAIQTQFHHLVRTIPGEGLIISPARDAALNATLARGCWTPRATLGEGGDWQARPLAPDYSRFEVVLRGQALAAVEWETAGRHNALNALAAIAAARHAGVQPATSIAALRGFRSVKRRMEKLAEIDGVTIYDDFAHHPTAVAATLAALRARIGAGVRIIAVLEPRSNTMKLGVHRQELAHALAGADAALLLRPEGLGWDLSEATRALGSRRQVFGSVEEIIAALAAMVRRGDQILIMSNGGFGGIHQRLPAVLRGHRAGN